MQSNIERSIDVEVPVETAYNQWTQFEEFPRFMDGIQEVRQLDDTHLLWCANIGGKDKTWKAEIVEQTPDARIAWKAIEGAKNAGVVTFHRLAPTRTRVMLQLSYDPDGIIERLADAAGWCRAGWPVTSSASSSSSKSGGARPGPGGATSNAPSRSAMDAC